MNGLLPLFGGSMKRVLWLNLSLILILVTSLTRSAYGFCGLYVAKADASLFNEASQVVIVRDENHTAITMFSDYQGNPKDFAVVVPVPEVLTREQINVGDRAVLEHLDAFSAPRLVEYYDPDPCAPPIRMYEMRMKAPTAAVGSAKKETGLGVKIEAKYTVGEYDILILSAKESSGLESWLKQNGYQIPPGASKALEPYIKQNMKFFVAKINLKEHAKSGFSYLRPLQFAFSSEKFMLPIRLGMVNAKGPQDMLVYAITKSGRVETTNYRTVKLPTGMDIPLYVKDDFANFYRAMFQKSHEREDKKVVFLEYAWNMMWCDPCAAEPLTPTELRKLGVFWPSSFNPNPPGRYKPRIALPKGGEPIEAFVTRLHVRYDAEHFPEDLMFQVTANSENFQGRYVLRHPFTGNSTCSAADTYKKQLKEREEKEVETLASLTGWPIEEIAKKTGIRANPNAKSDKWYQGIFK